MLVKTGSHLNQVAQVVPDEADSHVWGGQSFTRKAPPNQLHPHWQLPFEKTKCHLQYLHGPCSVEDRWVSLWVGSDMCQQKPQIALSFHSSKILS